MGIFDDLIPDSAKPVRAKPTTDAAGIFDDLIPAASSADGMFDDLIPAEGAEIRTPAHIGGPDETDGARADRGFGRSAYFDDGALNITSPSARRRPQSEPDPFATESLGDTAVRRGQQFARGATEVAAAVPESLAIASRQGAEARAEDTAEARQRRTQQIADIEARLARPDLDEKERQFREQQLADLRIGQTQTGEMQDRLEASAAIPAQDRDLFKAGDKIRAASQGVFGAPDPRDSSFWGQVAEGAGNMSALAVTALAGPGGIAVGGGLGASMNTSSLYKEAIEAGASEQDALQAANWGAAIGASEIVPINRALKLLPPRLREKTGGALYRRVSDIVQGAGEEAAQEYLATVANNMVAQGIYDPDRGWTEGATEAALVGAVLGGALGGAGSAPNGERNLADDPERLNSLRLTEADRASPIPNALIDDGKATIDAITSGQPLPAPQTRRPTPPNLGVAPLDETGANVRTPDIAPPRAIAELRPEAPVAPRVGQPPAVGGTPTNISDPIPEVNANGQDTGRMVRIDLDTGQIIENAQGPQEIAEAAPVEGVQNLALATPTEGVAPPDAPAQGVNETVTLSEPVQEAPQVPAVEVKERRINPNRQPSVQKRPLAAELRGVGVRPGSPLAAELNARGIDNRTHPGMFKASGATDWDNLPVSEYQDIAISVGDDGNGYLSQDGLVEALEAEARGDLLPVGEQADLRSERAAKKFEAGPLAEIDLAPYEGAAQIIPPREQDISTDDERGEQIRRSVDAVLSQSGVADIFEQNDYIEIQDYLANDGGSVEDAIEAQVARSVERAERTEQADRIARSQAISARAVSGFEQPGSGSDPQSAIDASATQRSQQGIEGGQRVDERAAQVDPLALPQDVADVATSENGRNFTQSPPQDPQDFAARSDLSDVITLAERTEAGEQTVIPGAEQSEDRSAEARKGDQQREVEVRAQQSKMRTSTPQADAGGLFDAQGGMFDDLVPPKPVSKATERLTENLRTEWTAREALPDDDSDGFLAATVKIKEARNLLEGEIGSDATNAALERIEADYQTSSVPTVESDARPTDDDSDVIAEQVAPTQPGLDQIKTDVVERMLPELRQRLDKAMLGKVALEIAPAGSGFQAALEGDNAGNLKILVGATLDAEKSVDHEAFHALRAMDLFTDGEWSALSSRAKKVWLRQYDIPTRYPDLDAEGQIEEAIAEAYANRAAPKSGLVATAFAKVRRFFKAMGEALRGSEINSTDDLFQQVEAGAVGARAAGSDTPNSAIDLRKEQRPPLSPDGRSALAASTKTAHIPDRTIWQEAADRNVNLLRPKTGIRGAIDDRADRFRELIQDRMLILRRAEEAIEEFTGDEITKADSAYYAEERYSGRVGAQLDALTEQYHLPIARIIARGSKIKLTDYKGEVRIDADAVGLWLTARHAKERNAYIGEVNDNMQDGGSGMTDAHADAILKAAEGQPFTSDLKTIGKMIDDLGAKMIDTREQAGLLTVEEASTWRAQYKHYVPLKGFAETDMYDEISNEATVRKGRSFTVQGKESRQAMGRTSEAFDPLSTMLAQAEEVVVRAEKNRVARTLFDLVKKHPSPAIWEIKEPETRRVFNKAAGRVETQIVNPANVQLGPNEMALKVDGIEKRINFVDTRLGAALGQVGADQLGRFSQLASYFSRYFSTVNTMLSPPFMIVNGFRDMVTAQINAGQFPKTVRGPIRKAMVRDWTKAFAGAYAGQGEGGGTSDFAKHYREYAEVGAKVAFWKVETPDAQNDRLAKLVRLETGSKAVRGLKKNLTLSTDTNPALGWIERVNLSVDNAIRLASFVEARRQGMTVEEAASLSKNLTVNFNRRGTAGAAMNAWYPFANAAIQGSHVLLKAARAAPVRRTLYGAFMIGFVNELLNGVLSEEDEDGELIHDKIPDYISSRNLIVSTGGDARATIPLPYGFNAVFYAGQQAAKVFRGVKDADEVMGDIAMTTFGAFSPISGETVTQTLLPTLGDHLFELATNSDWQSRPIRPESAFGDYGPQAYQEWNVPAPFSMAARGLNTLTGGSELESGMIDVSPEYMHHTFKFLGGGALRFVDKVTDGAAKIATGEGVEAHRVPLLRVLRYEPSDWLNQGRYFEFKAEVQEATAMVKRAKENRTSVPKEMAETAKLAGQLKSAEKQRRNYSKLISNAYAHPTKTDAQKRTAIEPLMERRNDAYVKFNRAFIKAKGPQSE